MNYIYSIFRRVRETSTIDVWRSVFLFLIFGPGMLLTILFSLLFRGIDAFFWGESTVFILTVGWIFYPGYKYLENVKTYSKRTAIEAYYLLMALMVLLDVGIMASIILFKPTT